MKVLEREEVVVAPRNRGGVSPRTPARKPLAPRPLKKTDLNLDVRVAHRPAVRRQSGLAVRAVTFGTIVGLTYVFSTLAGYVSLEGARQTARHGIERANFARQEAKAAREEIESLTNPAKLRAWADTHGFVLGGEAQPPAVKVPQGGGLVALR